MDLLDSDCRGRASKQNREYCAVLLGLRLKVGAKWVQEVTRLMLALSKRDTRCTGETARLIWVGMFQIWVSMGRNSSLKRPQQFKVEGGQRSFEFWLYPNVDVQLSDAIRFQNLLLDYLVMRVFMKLLAIELPSLNQSECLASQFSSCYCFQQMALLSRLLRSLLVSLNVKRLFSLLDVLKAQSEVTLRAIEEFLMLTWGTEIVPSCRTRMDQQYSTPERARSLQSLRFSQRRWSIFQIQLLKNTHISSMD